MTWYMPRTIASAETVGLRDLTTLEDIVEGCVQIKSLYEQKDVRVQDRKRGCFKPGGCRVYISLAIGAPYQSYGNTDHSILGYG